MSLAALALACVAAPIFDRLSAGRLFANPKVRDLFLLGGTCILAAMLAGHCLWCAAPSNSGDRRGRAFAIGAFGCLSLALLTLAISSLAPEIQKTIILLGLRLDWQDWAVWFFYLSAFLSWSWHVLSLLYLGSVAQNLGRRELHSRIAGFLVIFGLFSLAAVVIALTSTFALLCSLPVAILWYLPLLLRVRTAIGEST